jgi:hypothetical protein
MPPRAVDGASACLQMVSRNPTWRTLIGPSPSGTDLSAGSPRAPPADSHDDPANLILSKALSRILSYDAQHVIEVLDFSIAH